MLDIEKTIEALIYISHKTNNLIYIMKVLYFADKHHLGKYGRYITGDNYIAMPNGPVPSGAYDLIKYVRGDGFYLIAAPVEDALRVENKTQVVPLRKPDDDFFSESDLECLHQAMEEVLPLSLDELMDKCQKEEPYIKAKQDRSHYITFNSVLDSLDNSDIILEYLNS